MNRSKSQGLFLADLCSNFAAAFGALFRDDLAEDLYRNVHFLDTLEPVDSQPIDLADHHFNRDHRPLKYEEGRQQIYKEIDQIQPQRRRVLIKNLSTGESNFRTINMGLRAGRFDVRANTELEETRPATQFKLQVQARGLKV